MTTPHCGGYSAVAADRQAEASHLRQERTALEERLAAGERERQSLERSLQAEQRKARAALGP